MKKSIVSFLAAALLLSSVSSVALAEQNAVSPQGLITPLADSGWQTKNKIRQGFTRTLTVTDRARTK
ncbi:hypothetical protein [Paenibacillus sp. RC84]|uniref:hypothetical protein n=1 Tax=Paenibacillus sp. RC84 TaxID=3156252 RepID=UPI00351198B1